MASEYGVSIAALHRHHHHCRSRAIVPVVASTADLIEVLPAPPAGQSIDYSAGLDRLFAEATAQRRTPAERRDLAAYITDRAAIYADAVGDVRGALAASRAIRWQADHDQEAARQEQRPPPYIDKTLALLAAIVSTDPKEKQAAWRDAGLREHRLD